jgi:hypothetical protein
MLLMQEDGKPLSHLLALRRDHLIEQLMLNFLRQVAPNLTGGFSKAKKKLRRGRFRVLHATIPFRNPLISGQA